MSRLEPEFAEPFQTWKADPSPANADSLLKTLKPVIDNGLRTHGGPNPAPSLRSRAKLITLDALGKYDDSKAGLRTHLLTHLQGLRRHAARLDRPIAVPERALLEHSKLRQFESEMEDELGRPPTTLELADHAGIPEARVAKIRQAGRAIASSQYGGESSSVGQPVDMTPIQEFIYRGLNPTDRLILEHTLGLHGQQVISKGELARKLGLSQGAISQRAAKIAEQLDAAAQFGGV